MSDKPFIVRSPPSKLGHDPLTGMFTQNSFEAALPLQRQMTPSDISITEDGKKTTLNETTANCALTLVGAGILGIPYAFGQAGVLSVAMLLSITALTTWTAILIGRLMELTKPIAKAQGLPEEQRDWPFLGYVAFGDKGRAFCSFCFVSELWFCLILFLVINGTNMNVIFPEVITKRIGILVTSVMSFFLLFPSQKVLSYLSIFGVLSTVFGMSGLVWSASAMSTWEKDIKPWEMLNFCKVPMALGIFQCCFVAHSVFPSMYRGMENPSRDFAPAMTRAFSFAGLFYAAVGCVAYPVYGAIAQESFMQNLGRDLNLQPIPGLAFLYLVASTCFIINLQATFPVIANGLVTASEQALGISGKSFFIRTAWKASFMTLTTVVGIVLQDCMAEVQSIVGSFCATNTCLFFPIGFTLKLCETSRTMKLFMYLALVYSAWIMVYGTYTDVLSIIEKMS